MGRPDVVEVARPALQDGVFPVATVRLSERPAPVRFSAELPATVAAFRSEATTLPATYLKQRLCAGDEDVVARLGRAVEAAATLATPDEIRASYGSLLEYCGRREMCAWARAAVETGGALGELSWVGLAQCPAPENDALFESERAPARELIEYWSARKWTEPYVHRHIPAVAPALRRAVDLKDELLVRRAALVLGESGDPEGVSKLVALHGALQPGKLRDALAVGLLDSTAPDAKSIVAELCGRPGRKDPMCDRNPVVVTQLLPGVDAPPPDPAPRPERASAVKNALSEAGLLWRAPLGFDASAADPESAPESAEEWLVASGPVHCFDVETGMYPNEHDKLLLELAELAGPPLSGALFEESPPPLDLGEGKWIVDGKEVDRLPEGVAEGDPYRLRGYLDGRVYEVDAQDFGDWYDLDQVIGLLNAIAVDRKADIRLAVLPTRDQTACVLAAPRSAILAGVSARLLEPADSDAARSKGQAFEAEILEKLNSGEITTSQGN